MEIRNSKIANFAFSNDEIDLTEVSNAEVIDLTNTHVENFVIDNFPNLKRIRACQCSNLQKIAIKRCPSLEVIDLSLNNFLSLIELFDLPNLLSLDISNTNVSFLKFDLPKLESLILINTPVISLNEIICPNLLNLDVSDTKISNIEFIMDHKSLQRFRFSSSPYELNINLNVLSTHPKLSSLILGQGSVVCDSLPEKSNLKLLILENVDFAAGDPYDIHRFNYCDGYSYDIPKYDTFPSWTKSVRLLYGPWGVPKCDIIDNINPDSQYLNQTQIEQQKIPQFDHEKAADRILGAIFGSALGGMLGKSTEHTKRSYTGYFLETPVDIIWSHLNDDQYNSNILKGTVTSDIEQQILLMRTLSSHGNLSHFAQQLEEWISDGISEHKQGRCLHESTSLSNTIRHPFFHDDPHRAALDTCSEFTADGGATARTAPIGCFEFWDNEKVKKNARDFCCVTHYEARCIVCSMIVSLIISKNIQKASNLIPKNENENKNEIDWIDSVINEVLEITKDESMEYEDEIRCFLSSDSFDELVLDNGTIDYVLKSTGSAILALRKKMTFEQAINDVIRNGGKTDTNAATVGAVVGSAVGFSNLPKNLLKYLFNGNWIYNEVSKMLLAMGIEPSSSPFLETLSYA
ncbi:hypothetical protein TRFO_39723 [Tritrichomonas foetus]|uniref:Leucine Rich Repeat family protein n=1 Tax=Tritrichomonas foetus TaxID=1144522 RepID=A0A1J4J3N8_9EUKA|nr:hypothetical protein TRFO_39723 [Tritrichomonas foetus]|eukprot:OHS94072.1 hypothetical protein TRFO_39723 [Tritrichomonas foetus]